MHFVVQMVGDQEVAVPPVARSPAGGNSVKITNTLDKPLTVFHGGHLAAEDPFSVAAAGSGSAPQKTHAVAAGSDVSGTTFQFRIDASRVLAFGGVGDPTIIIL